MYAGMVRGISLVINKANFSSTNNNLHHDRKDQVMQKNVFDERPQRPPLLESGEILVAGALLAGGWVCSYLARERYHLSYARLLNLPAILVSASSVSEG